MEQTIIYVIFGFIIIGLSVVLWMMNQRLKDLKGSSAVELLKSDVTELARGISNLQQTVGDKLENNNLSMQTSMQKQLGESAKLVADVTQRLAKLDETNKRVVDVADELRTLQNVLQNPKQRGVFGEYYLETVLENVMHFIGTNLEFNNLLFWRHNGCMQALIAIRFRRCNIIFNAANHWFV